VNNQLRETAAATRQTVEKIEAMLANPDLAPVLPPETRDQLEVTLASLKDALDYIEGNM
jgi:hypothetical protein